ncbi:immunoglobulin domain-containing protein, partial [Silvimonas sp.]|uniref:immunoglobulin domain-containing protein n=1 Tax=Silvimonas sp. TaxID=2650811 RepID=UPI002844EE90
MGYQWQKNGLDLTEGGEISGSATTNLVLDAASTNDVGTYSVIVTNVWGSITSSVASLTVAFPPAITEQPTNQVVMAGEPASFSVAVSGTALLGYQWQCNGLALTDGGELSGSATTNLVLSAATINEAGNYTIIITNAWGSVTSSMATLTVVSPPVIAQQPTNQIVMVGGVASFSVSALGTAPLGYQWQNNGLALTDGGELSGSATTNLVLDATSTNDVGNYTVIVTNAWGSVTSSVASLTVAFPPVITSQPQSLTVTNSDPASFSVAVSGTASLSCQWQENGTNLTDGSTVSGSATTNLVLSKTSLYVKGNYIVIVTYAWARITSSVTTLSVVSPLVI